MTAYAPQIAGLEKIRASFLQVLVEREQTLSASLADFAVPDRREDAISAVEFVAHKIAGTGGVLGFADLGTKARTVEEAIGQARKSGAPRAEVLAAMVRDLAADCRTLLA